MKKKGLSAAEIDLLERIYKHDDAEAKEHFFDRYQDLLHRFAHKYHSDRLPYEDAYQLAALGLMKALKRFDPARGVSFITFAYPTMEGELKKHYRDHLEIIRLPRPLRDLHDWLRTPMPAQVLPLEEKVRLLWQAHPDLWKEEEDGKKKSRAQAHTGGA